jgi:hypothetical protein
LAERAMQSLFQPIDLEIFELASWQFRVVAQYLGGAAANV